MTGLTILLVISVAGVLLVRRVLRRTPGETAVEVFVDDAVRGHLPLVCAKTGARADSRLPITVYSKRFNPLWLLLILLGPLGWLVLIGVALFGDRGEALVVRMPMTTAVMERYVRARRRLNAYVIGFVIGVPVVAVALVVASRTEPADAASGPQWAPLLAVGFVLLAGSAGLLHAAVQTARTHFVIELDASRRWVTIGGVCPDFAAAASERTAASSYG